MDILYLGTKAAGKVEGTEKESAGFDHRHDFR